MPTPVLAKNAADSPPLFPPKALPEITPRPRTLPPCVDSLPVQSFHRGALHPISKGAADHAKIWIETVEGRTSPGYDIPADRLRRKIGNSELSVCLRVLAHRTGEIAHIARASGFDALYVDMEHSAISPHQVAEICSVALAMHFPALVRVPEEASSLATILLDAGAAGIILPHIENAESARKAVAACKFPPLGARSISGAAIHLHYADTPLEQMIDALNRAAFLAVMLESRVALANADAIAQVEGPELLLVGTSDLCIEMGIPGQHGHPAIEEAYRHVAKVCKAHGKAFGIAGIGDRNLIAKYAALGATFVSAGSDHAMLLDAARQRVKVLRDVVAPSSNGTQPGHAAG
ncbi:aldolase/citrate lyase family protein [Bosea sp. (in: a-proteobacteria)]|uniref:HpcH/HpaI aldolase family protein n=1 Tax=Bosea sp. (in: a-proteobacteria) TaxID=1871050 RepID=UPI00263073A3|nr:aldolase/citrate lyase family protein [Bosea sp. (in: a-proteobacteria)]MCO5090220.1 aldolase/citrate lyase family protein [Bosea sp. (in: a-proteobacteria)]